MNTVTQLNKRTGDLVNHNGMELVSSDWKTKIDWQTTGAGFRGIVHGTRWTAVQVVTRYFRLHSNDYT